MYCCHLAVPLPLQSSVQGKGTWNRRFNIFADSFYLIEDLTFS